MNPRCLSRVVLSVRDYDRSRHFYRDLLGEMVPA
jgi:catechol 2,3-dioxygenase-like lactoylglutathione lyase family enzyme